MRRIGEWVYVTSPMFINFVRYGKIINRRDLGSDGIGYAISTGPGDVVFRGENSIFDTKEEAQSHAERNFK